MAAMGRYIERSLQRNGVWRSEGEQGKRARHDRRDGSGRAGPESHDRHRQRDHERQYELHGEERSELVDGGVVGSADQRGAEPPIGKEVTDRDHGGSERHHAERRSARAGARARACRRTRPPGAGRADRQEHRANRPTIAYRRRAFRRRGLLRPLGLIAMYSYYEARCARLTSRAPGRASSLLERQAQSNDGGSRREGNWPVADARAVSGARGGAFGSARRRRDARQKPSWITVFVERYAWR